MAVIINISLDPEHDRDILRWLGRQSNRSAAVRKAIRAYMDADSGVTLAEVLAEIRALPEKLSVVAVAAGVPVDDEGEEPEVAAANLDGLLGRLDGGDLG